MGQRWSQIVLRQGRRTRTLHVLARPASVQVQDACGALVSLLKKTELCHFEAGSVDGNVQILQLKNLQLHAHPDRRLVLLSTTTADQWQPFCQSSIWPAITHLVQIIRSNVNNA
jgi:hypothetical protein